MQPRPLIEFELFPPSAIDPWTTVEGDDPHLCGDQLSQAWIGFNVGAQTLLEYSPEIRTHWAGCSRLADQMLGSVHSDLCTLLNRILDPIPDDLLWWMQSQTNAPDSRWGALCSRLWDESAGEYGSPIAEKICDAFRGRTLLLDRLVQSPDITFWSNGPVVFIGWDNRDKQVDGIPVWTATHGVYALARDDFLAQFQDFRERYFAAMAKQLALVRGGALPPGIRTEVDRDEQFLSNERAESLASLVGARSRYEPTDWEAVRAGLQQAQKITGLVLS